jgi:hypothetical protein
MSAVRPKANAITPIMIAIIAAIKPALEFVGNPLL